MRARPPRLKVEAVAPRGAAAFVMSGPHVVTSAG